MRKMLNFDIFQISTNFRDLVSIFDPRPAITKLHKCCLNQIINKLKQIPFEVGFHEFHTFV